jgi:hypothetical protein
MDRPANASTLVSKQGRSPSSMYLFARPIALGLMAALDRSNQQETTMIATALEQTTDTESNPQNTVETVETVALDEVNGGWMYSPYSPYANPYAMAYASPYAAARYEAHLERRAAWLDRRAARWWY